MLSTCCGLADTILTEVAVEVAHVELHEAHALAHGKLEPVLREFRSVWHDADREPFHLLEHLGSVWTCAFDHEHGIEANRIHKPVHREIILPASNIRSFSLALNIMKHARPNRVSQHIHDLAPVVENADLDLQEPVLVADCVFADLVAPAKRSIDVRDNRVVVL